MKNQKGVTLITLTITIVVLMILTFTVTVNFEPYKNQKIKTKFETDMQRLKEELAQYYTRVKDIPVINKYTNVSMLNGVKNINDGDEYYVIDIGQLDVELNYGADYYKIIKKPVQEEITDLSDVYIINKQSHTIYYPKGVEYDGMKHYRVAERYSEIYITVEDLRESKQYVNKDTVARDSYGNLVWIPEGFKVAQDSGVSVTEGVVIEDKDIKSGIGKGKRKSICMDSSRRRYKKITK